MPELPEAETIVRGLRGNVVGRRISSTTVIRPDVLDQTPGQFVRAIKGLPISGVSRRGKNVIIELGPSAVLKVNLGMTGGLFPLGRGERNSGVTHPAVRFRFVGGGQLVYNDARRFGRLRVFDQQGWSDWSDRLGPEPLSRDFSDRQFAESLRASRTPIRNWLLDQRRVAGVGNIYASEALFRARVDPRRSARSLSTDEAGALRRAVTEVLQEAVDARGTTIRDYKDADGAAGSFGPRLHVYGREAKPCRACGTAIVRVVFGNRSAFLCPACQPWPEMTARQPA